KSFYYGGDLNFGNMNSFFRQGGMTELIDENQFAASDQNSKWGVHDHIVFERLKEDLSAETEVPFFKTIFTLSSHEPFEFPGEYKFGNDSEINSFRSAHAYTDAAVGDFVQWCKDQSWWDNTLLIITADHGHKLPQHEGPFNGPLKYQVPMLWLGGALKSEPVMVDHICSQIDLPYSLLLLLGADVTGFDWSHNVLIESPEHFAHYIYNKGFGTINESGFIVYDYVSDRIIAQEAEEGDGLLDLGLSITQTAYQDFVER
ncbi:MAG: LTA synthase family protein, partial [Saprospiraceae bacterium]|nr:LTA synthase family protein [Saprospiraceae bacterium]